MRLATTTCAALLCCLLVACGPPSEENAAPASDTSARDAGRPFFEGAVGQFDAATAFIEFITAHAKEIVRLDVTIEEQDFDGTLEGQSYFVLWDDCAELEPGQAPSTMNCTGWSFLFEPAEVPESTLHLFRGTYRVEGYFAVVGCSGPHQGLMGCTLRPVSIEDATR